MLTREMLQEYDAEITELMKTAGDGPWCKEPNRFEFKHAGFDCLAVRQFHGAWCGYVGVTEEHPYFGKNYDDLQFEVHGGLTYAKECSGVVCHFSDNESKKRWWFGFDCAHAQDLVPCFGSSLQNMLNALEEKITKTKQVYRNLDYVIDEIKSLAEQLKTVGVKRSADLNYPISFT